MNKFALKAAVVMFAATSFLTATPIPAVAAGWMDVGMDVIKFCLKYNCAASVLKMGPILEESSALAFGRKLAEKELSSARLLPASPFPSNMTSTFEASKVIFNKEAVAATKIDNSWITFEALSGKLSVDSSLTFRGLKLKAGDINLYKVSGISAGSIAICNSVNILKYEKCIEEIAKRNGVMQPVPAGSNEGNWMESAGQATNPNPDLVQRRVFSQIADNGKECRGRC